MAPLTMNAVADTSNAAKATPASVSLKRRRRS